MMLMGPVKAALESAVRYTAAEPGAQGIRASAISPGPISTRAASGIDRFDERLATAAAEAPEHQLVDIDDVGALAAFLVSDAARRVSGNIIPVDAGRHLIAWVVPMSMARAAPRRGWLWSRLGLA